MPSKDNGLYIFVRNKEGEMLCLFDFGTGPYVGGIRTIQTAADMNNSNQEILSGPYDMARAVGSVGLMQSLRNALGHPLAPREADCSISKTIWEAFMTSRIAQPLDATLQYHAPLVVPTLDSIEPFRHSDASDTPGAVGFVIDYSKYTTPNLRRGSAGLSLSTERMAPQELQVGMKVSRELGKVEGDADEEAMS